jgi:hypothetical protein
LKKTVLLSGLCVFINGCSGLVYMTGRGAVPLDQYSGIERTPVYHQGDWIIARASMHNHTIYSDGCRTPEDVLALARLEGMAILSYNDHREGGVCFRKNLCLPINGIERAGYEAYFEHLEKIKGNSDDVIVIYGAEVIPYFYNVGKPPNFTIFAENFHFTVYDVHDPKVFWDMPARREMRSLKPEPLPGLRPYQEFVDYVVEHGGIVHAVHVESSQDDRYGPAHFISAGPVNHVYELKGLTGFSILPEGYHYRAGGPGGFWDAALNEYLLGARGHALWAMGDSDYHCGAAGLARATTLFYMKEFTEAEVYRCLREGRMVALMGESFQDSFVSEFSVSDRAGAKPIMFGEEVQVSGPPRIRFSLDHEVPDVRSRLIRNGEVIHETAGSSFEYVDRGIFNMNVPAVYRVEVKGPRVERTRKESWVMERDSELFTNPIFVYIEK